jgi:hypothetical protein
LLASIDLLGDDGGSTFPPLLSDKQERSNRGSDDDEIDCSEEGQGRRSDQEGIEESRVTTHDSRIRMLDLSKKKRNQNAGCVIFSLSVGVSAIIKPASQRLMGPILAHFIGFDIYIYN